MNVRLILISSFLLYSFGARAGDISSVLPGADVSTLIVTGYSTKRHVHPAEEPQPCILFTSSTNVIHALLDRQNNRVIAVLIEKGSYSPVSIKIGDTLEKVKAAFPAGKIMRYDSELIDPVSFRVMASGKKLAFTVEWEPTFYVQGGNWETFSAEKVPSNAKVLGILWE